MESSRSKREKQGHVGGAGHESCFVEKEMVKRKEEYVDDVAMWTGNTTVRVLEV